MQRQSHGGRKGRRRRRPRLVVVGGPVRDLGHNFRGRIAKLASALGELFWSAGRVVLAVAFFISKGHLLGDGVDEALICYCCAGGARALAQSIPVFARSSASLARTTRAAASLFWRFAHASRQLTRCAARARQRARWLFVRVLER